MLLTPFTVKPEDAPPVNQNFLDNLGTVEVVVLRCKSHSGINSSLGHMIDVSDELPIERERSDERRAFGSLASRYKHDSRRLGRQLDGGEDWQNENQGDGGWPSAGDTSDQPVAWGDTQDNNNGETAWNESKNDTASAAGSNKSESARSNESGSGGNDNSWLTSGDDNKKKPDDNPFSSSGNDKEKKKKKETGNSGSTGADNSFAWGSGSAKSTLVNGSSSNSGSDNKDRPGKDAYKPIPNSKKDYWTKWSAGHRGYGPAPDGDDRDQHKNPDYNPYIAPAYAISPVCAKHAYSRGVEAHVKTGPAARYKHAFGRPDYLDSMEAPYAVFTFHYRTAQVLSKIVRKNVQPDHENEYQKVRMTSRAQLEQELLRYKVSQLSWSLDDAKRLRPGKRRRLAKVHRATSRQSRQAVQERLSMGSRAPTNGSRPVIRGTRAEW